MARVLKGIDLRDLIDLEAEFGTVLGGPAGSAGAAPKEVKRVGQFVVPGIGKLVRVDRKARMGLNPATGEAIKIPAKNAVRFRVAKAAKDAIVPKKK